MMDMLKSAGGRVAALGSAVGTLLVLGVIMAGQASATPADPGEEAITDLGTKVTLYGAAVLAVCALGIGIALAIKYMRAAKRAA